VGAPFNTPANYVDVALRQNIKLDRDSGELCKLVAECNLNGTKPALQDAFVNRIHAAYMHQLRKSSEGRAKWCQVDFDVESETHEGRMS